MADRVSCILGDMVGAGFASGREVMQFFSQYGAFSWVFILLASGLMGGLMFETMVRTSVGNGKNRLFSILLFFTYLSVGGGMAAAAGNLAALTIPLQYARALGTLLTLGICVLFSVRSLRGMAFLGKILLPCMVLLIVFCLQVPGGADDVSAVSVKTGFYAVIQMIGYCGMNVLLALSVLSEAGKSFYRKDNKKVTLLSAILIGCLLVMSNAALLPHIDEMKDASLPMVLLMRSYGKFGYYFSAVVLYLAVATTLIAVLRGMIEILKPLTRYHAIISGLFVMTASLIGFQEIVRVAYPLLGWAYLLWVGGTKNNIFSCKKESGII